MSGKLLQGITVLDFGEYAASAFITRIMADMGAEVLKVERYPMGDPMRTSGGKPGEASRSAIFWLSSLLNINAYHSTAQEMNW